MSEKYLSTVATVTQELNSPARNQEKLALLSRALRWHRDYDAEDMAALTDLAQMVRDQPDAEAWNVEQAILETLCDQARVEHVPFLVETFRRRTPGKHSNDRRRLALQALSGVAARTNNEEALQILAEGLSHYKKDTRGWSIGFLLDTYHYLDRSLPPAVIDRLHHLVDHDVSGDVRVEAITALAALGLADQKEVEAVVILAQRGQKGSAQDEEAA